MKIYSNFKMNKTSSEIKRYFYEFVPLAEKIKHEFTFMIPFVSLDNISRLNIANMLLPIICGIDRLCFKYAPNPAIIMKNVIRINRLIMILII